MHPPLPPSLYNPTSSQPLQTLKTKGEMSKSMAEDKRGKVKKGCIAVRVGLEDGCDGFKRFTIPITYLHHPLFKSLLETSREVYGYPSSGPLKLPCSVDDFLHVRWLIERESSSQRSANSHHGNHYLHSSSFSLHSC